MGPKELPVVKEEEEDEEEDEEMETVVIGAPEEKWDCETIISEFNLHSMSLINCNVYVRLPEGQFCRLTFHFSSCLLN